MQTVLGKRSGGYVKSALNDVLYALWQRVPTTAEVAFKHFYELCSRDVLDVLVGEVAHTHDGTFLHGPCQLRVLVECHRGYLIAHLLIFSSHYIAVVFQVFEEESCLDDIRITTQVFNHLCIFLCTFQHTEDIVLLNVPHVTLCECLQGQCLIV